MELSSLLKELDVSKISLAWSFLTGGWSGLAKMLCEAFTKLLKKADPEKLKEYSVLAGNIAAYLKSGINLFVKNETVKIAAEATANTIETLANHISNGVYDEEELNDDITNIRDCIDAWKTVTS